MISWSARSPDRSAGRTAVRGGLVGSRRSNVKILLVVSRSPFPPRRGDQMRAVQALEILGSEHQITLVTPRGGQPPAELGGRVRFETYEPPGRFARLVGVAGAAVQGQPLQAGLFRSSDLARKLRTLAPRHDLVVLQLERLIGHLPDLLGVPLVVDLIDSLSLNFERRADFDSWIWRPALRFEAARLLGAERRLASRAFKVLVVSERDRHYLEGRLGPELAAKVAVVPLSMSIPEDLPPTLRLWKRPGEAWAGAAAVDPIEPGEPKERPLLAMTGNLGYFPTLDGALWFLESVWPLVRAARPEVRFVLAGARPPRRLRTAIARGGAELIESPPDLRSILKGATLALAPMRAGSGLPVKVLEAWLEGVPVVATPWAAEGVSGHAGLDLAVVEPQPAGWCGEILRLLGDPGARARLVARARERLAADYGAEIVADRWRAAIEGASD